VFHVIISDCEAIAWNGGLMCQLEHVETESSRRPAYSVHLQCVC